MSTARLHDSALVRTLILDEMFDLALYREFHAITDGPLRDLLTELIRVEETHVSFWRQFFETSLRKLDLPRRLKLRLIVWSCRLLGAPVIHIMLEAIRCLRGTKISVDLEDVQGPAVGRGRERDSHR